MSARVRPIALAILVGLSLLGCSSAPAPRGPSLEQKLAEPLPPAPPPPTDTDAGDAMHLHAIDIGQGLALLVEFPCGVMLYDTGGEKNKLYDSVPVIVDYLDRFFASRPELDKTIDLLVLSHPHIDHTRGVEAVLKRYKVRNVVDNGDDIDTVGGQPQKALHRWIREQNDKVPYYGVRRDAITSKDGLTNDIIDPIGGCERAKTDPHIRALWGGSEMPAEIGHNANNDSVVLRIDYGKTSFLLPGDLEIIGWAKMTKKLGMHNPIYDVDVYVVGHHGSKNATVEYMMRLMSPKIAVISAGPYDRYLRIAAEFTARKFGHPNAKAIRHLISDDYGVSMWRPKPLRAWVGIKGGWKLERFPVWEEWVIRRAVYATSWDGNVTVNGNANGYLSVDTQLPEGKWHPDPGEANGEASAAASAH